jgi:hypothetical protein
MAYTHTTLTAAENLLAGMLADSAGAISKVRWVSLELRTLIIEAMRTWGGITGVYEATTAPVAIAADTQFVDLPATFATELGYSVTVQDLIGAIQYHLFEPYDPIDGTGMTEMFSFARIVAAIQRRRDQLLLETGCRLTRDAEAPDSPGVIDPETSSYALPDTTIAVARAAWTDLAGTRHPLRETTSWGVRNAEQSIRLASALPEAYEINERLPISLNLAPVPAAAGRLDLLTVETGATLVAASNTLLGVPDDFAPAIKWGAMADLLAEDRPGRDYARSLFCERRWRLLVAALANRGVLVDARINGRLANLARSVAALDEGDRYWQSRRSRDPQTVAMAGRNLLAIATPPNRTVTLELTLRRKTPVPAIASPDTECLQIGREHLALVLGYAVHLGMFKIGGTELAGTSHLVDSMMQAAADYNSDLRLAYEAEQVEEQDEKKKAAGVRRVTGQTLSEE